MYLAYFDETKYSKENPYFLIGGIIVDDERVVEAEGALIDLQYRFFGTSILSKDTEMHGKEIFQGKGSYKNRKLEERLQIFEDIAGFVTDYDIATRIICINVEEHRKTFKYPHPEYRLGLILLLESLCNYLDQVDGLAVVFGDYEKDEITRSILDFSQFKPTGKIPIYSGRPLGRLIDTIYFTHSHHSRFLQVSDLLIYMANRYENGVTSLENWRDQKLESVWRKITEHTNYEMKYWPHQE